MDTAIVKANNDTPKILMNFLERRKPEKSPRSAGENLLATSVMCDAKGSGIAVDKTLAAP